MAADFFFDNPTFEIPPLQPRALFGWQRLGNPEVQYAIAAQEQYLHFHMYMLNNLRHTSVGNLAAPPYRYQLGLSVRAGAIKAAILIAASIIEAALRAIAEARGYTLPADPRRRTFGKVIQAWETAGVPHADVAAIWADVLIMHSVRNTVHLHVAAVDTDAAWEQVLLSENALLTSALRAIEHVSLVNP
jgi:hypothetical protein